MKSRWTRLQNIIIGLLCLLGPWLLIDRLFLYLGICIYLDLGKQTQRSVPRFVLHSHALRVELQFADIFHDLPMAHKITVNQTGAFYFSQACSEDVSYFSRNEVMTPFVLFQSLWMFFLWLVFTSNLNSQTTWLKVKLKLVNFRNSRHLQKLDLS